MNEKYEVDNQPNGLRDDFNRGAEKTGEKIRYIFPDCCEEVRDDDSAVLIATKHII